MWKQVEAAYEAQRKAEGGGWLGASAGTEITAISKAWDDLRLARSQLDGCGAH